MLLLEIEQEFTSAEKLVFLMVRQRQGLKCCFGFSARMTTWNPWIFFSWLGLACLASRCVRQLRPTWGTQRTRSGKGLFRSVGFESASKEGGGMGASESERARDRVVENSAEDVKPQLNKK